MWREWESCLIIIDLIIDLITHTYIYIYIYIYVCILHGIVSVVVSRKAKEFNEDGLSFVNGHQVLN